MYDLLNIPECKFLGQTICLLQELLETYASETLIQQGEEAKTLLGYS